MTEDYAIVTRVFDPDTEKAVISAAGIATAAHTARINTLRANTTWATNTIKDPKRIVLVSSTLNISGERIPYVAPAYSIQVLEMDLR